MVKAADDYKLNIQAIARRHEPLVSSIVPDPGFVFISQDLGAGEPTCTAHYSRDPAYRYATLDGIGKEPFWKNGVLWIDDVYLMVMSVSPIGRKAIKAAWDRSWDGKTFVEQWMEKSKVVKTYLDEERQLHKMLGLALGYSMGPKKMQTQVKTQFSRDLSFTECKQLYMSYWNLFGELRKFVDVCTDAAKRDGVVVNDFGYRIKFITNGNRKPENGPCDTTHKAYNYFIQSTVSGIMHKYTQLVCDLAAERGLLSRSSADWQESDLKFVTVIHDEDVWMCKEERVEEFRQIADEATQRLNDYLEWTVPIRVGFSVGANFYQLK